MAQLVRSIATGADDGYAAIDNTATYNPAVTPATNDTDTLLWVMRGFNTGSTLYRMFVSFMRFDTSALPDNAAITGATLTVFVEGHAEPDGLSLVMDWYQWSPTVDAADYTHAANSNALSQALSSLTGFGTQNLTLTNADQFVSRTGYTHLRAAISQRAADAAPTGENWVAFASFENATDAEATLTLDYQPRSGLAPDAIISQTNLTGAVSVIQDDPDSADANWLTAP